MPVNELEHMHPIATTTASIVFFVLLDFISVRAGGFMSEAPHVLKHTC